MPDIEKVMNGLEHCSDRSCKCDKCAYWNPNRTIDDEYCGAKVNRDALELLKEQQAEIDRLKNDKANVIKLLEKEREENKPGSDYVIRPMRASDINEQHKGMYYAFSFAINALIEKGR